MAMRTIENIQADYDEIKSWSYDDERCDDAAWRDGALAALDYVLKLPETERLEKTVEAVNKAGAYSSWCDDYCDANQYGYETTLLFCLNRVVRRYPITIEDIQRDPVGCDHEFDTESDGVRYVYVCEKCGHRES